MEAVLVSNMSTSEFIIEVPWGLIAGKVWGSPGAPPVLCIHGIQDNANTFDHLVPLLPSSFCYVVIDLPGHGRSSHLPAGMTYSLLDYCLTVERVRNHFGWKRFTFLGHSLGGQIGFLYAAFYPEHVMKLIVLDSMLPYGDITENVPKFQTKVLEMEKIMAFKIPPSYSEEEALRRLTEGRPSPLSPEAAQALFSRGVIKNRDGFSFSADQRLKLRYLSFFSKEQCLSFISRIKCPVYMVRASLTDTYNKSVGRYDFENVLKASLGNKIFYKLVEGTHDVHLLQPERFAADLSDFLIKSYSSL